MSNLIDLRPFWNRKPDVVRLRVVNDPHTIEVTGVNTEKHSSFSRLRDAADWLRDEGYEWVVGSNGLWARAAVQ